MKRVLIATVAFAALLTVSAKAADMPVKARPLPAPAAFSWAGFYVGAHVGGGWAKTNATTIETPVNPGVTADLQSFSLKGSGALGGVHAGYNWQVAPTWLLGIEGDFDWTGIKATTSVPLTVNGVPNAGGTVTSDTLSRNVNWLASIRGRVGYTAADWLFYATGGAAWGELRLSATQVLGPPPIVTWPFSTSTTRSGWVAGGGVEHALNKNWIVRGEYLYYDLSGTNGIGANTAVPPVFTDTFKHTTVQTARAGISYKF